MKLMQTKRGQAMNTFVQLGIGIVIVALVLAVGAIVLGRFRDTTTNADAQNITDELLLEIRDLPDWVGLVIVVSVAALVIGLVFVFQRLRG